MPIDLIFPADGRGIHLRCSGDLVARDFLAINTRLKASKRPLEAICYALVDETQVTSLNLSSNDLKSMVDSELLLAPSIAPGALVAVVSPQPEVFRITRLWRVFALKVGWETMAFHAIPEAWLRAAVKRKYDIPAEALSPYVSD
ncbi:MAG: hypothetical protein IPI84_01745 [Holophagaceae bacterium]|nr:hypothetical protein [Holophagaceae bacterium]